MVAFPFQAKPGSFIRQKNSTPTVLLLETWCYRCSQNLSIKYAERSAEAGIELYVGSVGDSYDHSLAETINGLYKAEVIQRRGPRRSFEAVVFATLE